MVNLSANEISNVTKQVTTLNGKLKEDTPKILEPFMRSTLEQLSKDLNSQLAEDKEYTKLKKAVNDYKQKAFEKSELCEYALYVAGRYANYAAKVYKLRYGCKMPENCGENECLKKAVMSSASDTEARIISTVCQFNDTFETKKAKVTGGEKISECAKEITEITKSEYPQKIKDMSLLGLKSKYGTDIFNLANEQAKGE